MNTIRSFDKFLNEQEEGKFHVILESKHIIAVFQDYSDAQNFFRKLTHSLYPEQVITEINSLRNNAMYKKASKLSWEDLHAVACENISYYYGNPDIAEMTFHQIMDSLVSGGVDIDSIVKNSKVPKNFISRMKSAYRGKGMFGV